MGRYNLHPAFEKLGRGLANSFGGWLEIPLGIHRRFSPEDTAGSFLTGAATGLFRGVVRTGVGIYETATFFLPYPEDFRPILPTLAYFDSEARKTLPLE
jgi:putative exosortase-associated protein (TIGR04073 family)